MADGRQQLDERRHRAYENRGHGDAERAASRDRHNEGYFASSKGWLGLAFNFGSAGLYLAALGAHAAPISLLQPLAKFGLVVNAHLPDRSEKRIRLLCARKRDLAIDDEKWHAFHQHVSYRRARCARRL